MWEAIIAHGTWTQTPADHHIQHGADQSNRKFAIGAPQGLEQSKTGARDFMLVGFGKCPMEAASLESSKYGLCLRTPPWPIRASTCPDLEPKIRHVSRAPGRGRRCLAAQVCHFALPSKWTIEGVRVPLKGFFKRGDLRQVWSRYDHVGIQILSKASLRKARESNHIGQYTILYYTILYYTILYYTILYYTILYYTILYYTILYYKALLGPTRPY